jgi:phage replication O-like protein O
MASPQCENGFVMVANELWDALILAKLGKEDMSVFLAIIRKTYGFKKKRDVIPISQLQNMTKLPRQSVCRSLKRLKSLKMIDSHAGATRTPSTYAPNKDWEQWLPSNALVTSHGSATTPSHASATTPSHASVSFLVTPARPSKESIQKKKTLKKSTKEKNLFVEQQSSTNGAPPYQEIIQILNQQTGKSFKHTTNETRALIQARWKNGFRLDDFKRVIEVKTSQWLTDAKMAAFLRPQTLFGTKFESYLNEQGTQAWVGKVSEKGAKSYQNLMRWAAEEESQCKTE